MKLRYGRTGLIAGVVALIGAGACNKSSPVIDDGLKNDLAAATESNLELTPKTGSQVVVSAIEGGPTSSPKRVVGNVQKPIARPVIRVARKQAPAPSRAVTQTAPVPTRAEPDPTPAVSRPSPAPASAPAAEAPGRVYKTEAEIFRQMPWIRP